MQRLGLKDVLAVKTEGDARKLAIDWQAWASEQDLSYGALVKWQNVFEQLGAKYNITDEFRENGII